MYYWWLGQHFTKTFSTLYSWQVIWYSCLSTAPINMLKRRDINGQYTSQEYLKSRASLEGKDIDSINITINVNMHPLTRYIHNRVPDTSSFIKVLVRCWRWLIQIHNCLLDIVPPNVWRWILRVILHWQQPCYHPPLLTVPHAKLQTIEKDNTSGALLAYS